MRSSRCIACCNPPPPPCWVWQEQGLRSLNVSAINSLLATAAPADLPSPQPDRITGSDAGIPVQGGARRDGAGQFQQAVTLLWGSATWIRAQGAGDGAARQAAHGRGGRGAAGDRHPPFLSPRACRFVSAAPHSTEHTLPALLTHAYAPHATHAAATPGPACLCGPAAARCAAAAARGGGAAAARSCRRGSLRARQRWRRPEDHRLRLPLVSAGLWAGPLAPSQPASIGRRPSVGLSPPLRGSLLLRPILASVTCTALT